ncbi:MAG: DUF1538 domain-containing protein [Pirellulaceae bacterium]|nr:DUF1538 domain-containing protein [Pirellulaceae bacterium]
MNGLVSGYWPVARAILTPVWNSIRDLIPIVSVVLLFQLAVFQQSIEQLSGLLAGLLLVIAGLSLFISGLELGLFPLGEGMAHDFARKGSVPWMLAFAFALGFGTTFAEPALIAISGQAASLSVTSVVDGDLEATRRSFALTLRLIVAVSVGLALVLGVIRIITGWPLHLMIMIGYVLVIILTPWAPREIVAIAYDSGGITTSTITVPLTTALGIGLASSIRGRNPMLDGFGLIAFASLLPILFVLVFGMLVLDTTQSLAVETASTALLEPGTESVVQQELFGSLLDSLLSTLVDVLPILGVVGLFQLLVLRRRIHRLPQVIWGVSFVITGLTCFLVGLELALFPLGETMALQLTAGVSQPAAEMLAADSSGTAAPVAWYHYYWTYLFAFAIGASTTIAEPSLIAVAMKAEEVSGGAVRAWGLRLTVALGVGIGVCLGTFRIVTGIPLPYFILIAYMIVIVQTYFAPRMIVPIAYDSGGVTTSTVTVPLVAALGIGLASNIPGRDPLIDGFGLIALAVLLPVISVMGYAQLAAKFSRS